MLWAFVRVVTEHVPLQTRRITGVTSKSNSEAMTQSENSFEIHCKFHSNRVTAKTETECNQHIWRFQIVRYGPVQYSDFCSASMRRKTSLLCLTSRTTRTRPNWTSETNKHGRVLLSSPALQVLLEQLFFGAAETGRTTINQPWKPGRRQGLYSCSRHLGGFGHLLHVSNCQRLLHTHFLGRPRGRFSPGSTFWGRADGDVKNRSSMFQTSNAWVRLLLVFSEKFNYLAFFFFF